MVYVTVMYLTLNVYLRFYCSFGMLFHASLQEGFYFHHAEPKYLMLVYWIPETPSTIPVNATHRVGIGGFVMNEKKEVLPAVNYVWVMHIVEGGALGLIGLM